MSVTVKRESPQIMTIRMNGKVGSWEWSEGLRRLDALTSSAILVIAKDFLGFGSGEWADLSFELAHDRQIKRMAIVAEPRFEEAALMFAGKDLQRFEIEYFPPSQLNEAREWLFEASIAEVD